MPDRDVNFENVAILYKVLCVLGLCVEGMPCPFRRDML